MRRAALVSLLLSLCACSITPMGGPIPAIAADKIEGLPSVGISALTDFGRDVEYTSPPFDDWERADVARTVQEALAKAGWKGGALALRNATLTWTSSNELRIGAIPDRLPPHEEKK
ncbi:hypothetical protein HY251_04265 [bacterium]|nr:hypothetical protein [bacterium]